MDTSLPPPVQSSRASGPEPREWLAQWPTGRRSLLANVFHYAVRDGACAPHTVIAAVIRAIQRRLRWGDDTTLVAVLAQLQTTPALALQYAETVIAYEHLPYAARQAQKAARSREYQLTHMQELPATEKQLAFLRALGHTGVLPAHRAEASRLIDALKRGEVA